MKEGKENGKKDPPPVQMSLDYRRTGEELAASIREKKARGEALDKEELKFLESQRASNRQDDQPRFGH